MKTDTIAVDVDGTLLLWPGEKQGRVPRPGESGHGEPPAVNAPLVKLIRAWARDGKRVVVWSMGGTDHARFAVKLAGIEDLIMPMAKPTVLIDDSFRWLERIQKIPAPK